MQRGPEALTPLRLVPLSGSYSLGGNSNGTYEGRTIRTRALRYRSRFRPVRHRVGRLYFLFERI